MSNKLLDELSKNLSSKEFEKRIAKAAWRLSSDPELTFEEALHDCTTQGHIVVSDVDRDLDWNEHFILLPQKCKICGLREFKVLRVSHRYSNEIFKRSADSV